MDTSGEVDDPDASGNNSGSSNSNNSGSNSNGSSNNSGSNNNGNNNNHGSGGSTSTGQKIPGKYIMVQKPEDVSVYFDDTYIGVAPVQIDKITGEHKITLRRDGYISKTYTVEVENDGEDTLYRFPNLTKE